MSARRRLPALPTFLAVSIAHLFAGEQGACAGGADVAAAAGLPFPATLESVVERGAIEGYPVSVVRLRSALSVGEALASARRAWSASDPDAVLVTRSGPWQVVSVRERSGYRTLQLRAAPDGGTEGLLSLWSHDGPGSNGVEPSLDASRLLPAGAQVLRRLDGVDGGRRHRTLVALTDGSVRWVADSLETRALALGFARDPVRRQSAGEGESRLYRSGRRDLGITVHPHEGRTAIVIHLTETAP